MDSAQRTVRPWLMLLVAAGAIFFLAGFVFFLPLAFDEPQAALPPVSRAATPEEARVALGRAAQALGAGDRAAYRAALPASGRAARTALGELFRHLSPLPWTTLTLLGKPGPGVPGRFDVRAVGQLGSTGPHDRVGGERILDLEMLGSRVVATADATPAAVKRQYLMAFHDPVAVSRNGLLVLADRRSRDRAQALADAGATARTRLALVGVTPDASVLVSVYSSLEDLKASLGGGPDEDRIRFFSHDGPRVTSRPWRILDIGVLGPSLDGTGAWMPLMLSHEMTHAYTKQWFAKTAHAPTFLLEGLAMAVEGGRDWTPLREEVATGNQLWPLLDAIGAGDLWTGNSTEQVRLAYLEAASVVLYVLDRWGLAKLRPFVTAAADSDLSEAGVGQATRSTLGVGWDEFYAGWKDYVLSLP
ncbi:MAG: hypothetical protein NTW58_06695 [Actinobacteria bacterium]|nr:hypothetical protein [Actinomycetota bacterium]